MKCLAREMTQKNKRNQLIVTRKTKHETKNSLQGWYNVIRFDAIDVRTQIRGALQYEDHVREWTFAYHHGGSSN